MVVAEEKINSDSPKGLHGTQIQCIASQQSEVWGHLSSLSWAAASDQNCGGASRCVATYKSSFGMPGSVQPSLNRHSTTLSKSLRTQV